MHRTSYDMPSAEALSNFNIRVVTHAKPQKAKKKERQQPNPQRSSRGQSTSKESIGAPIVKEKDQGANATKRLKIMTKSRGKSKLRLLERNLLANAFRCLRWYPA